ncbi:MAG: glycoside hydrolase family 31 protein [Spirochaetaceae bacterium]|nr:glycoside hydrolase family 31 protein [Spirochaetaceae bacterium]
MNNPLKIEGSPAPGTEPLSGLAAEKTAAGLRWSFRSTARHAWGMGERFDGVDRAGRVTAVAVDEKFTEQGPAAYFPVPFFFTELGFSIYIEGSYEVSFDLGATEAGLFSAEIRCGDEPPPALVLRYGTPPDLLAAFARETGLPSLPPAWAFGPWISANRWDRRSLLMEQIETMELLGIPATVAVIEAWSDEGGFFAWNDAIDREDGGYDYPEDGHWPDPEGMIAELAQRGIKVLLWQAPVCKRLGDCPEAARERQSQALSEAEAGGFLAKRADGSVYAIPEGRWFGGSPIPDFTNPAARAWYFDKRRHLLEQGVAGFKTDGGEFVYEDGLHFADGRTGLAMRSGYAATYLEAYGHFAGLDRLLFSRAGWTGSQRWSTHWAGDQRSTWAELRAQLSAGLSAGLSGAPFWTFDIGGFAGALPDAELYLRSFALAAYSPLMQWHSEPVYGQFADIIKASGGNNDRSPWNIAGATGDERVLGACRALSRLRMALIPYLSLCARRASGTGLPILRHLVLDFPDDARAAEIDDQFLLGEALLVAPVLEAGAAARSVFFPAGRWIDVVSGTVHEGPSETLVECALGGIPVFRREGAPVALDPAWIDAETPPLLA